MLKTYAPNEVVSVCQIPEVWSYGSYRSHQNYGVHTMAVSLNGIDFFYSYRTLVAFTGPDGFGVIRENEWGRTTGRHLCLIRRQHAVGSYVTVPREEFVTRLYNTLQAAGMVTSYTPLLRLPKKLQALKETGEIIRGDIPQESAQTPKLRRARLVAAQQETARQELLKARKQLSLERRRERQAQKKQEKQAQAMIAGLPAVELLEEML